MPGPISAVHLNSNEDGTKTLLIDGEDWSYAVSGARIEIDTSEVSTVTLTFPVFHVETNGAARVELEDSTKHLLQALGWAPPVG